MPSEKVIEVPRGEHSPLGPSSSKKWINCAGSLRASLGVKEDPSEYAAEGTCAHYLSELARKQNRPTLGWLGWKFKADGYTFEVDEEMAASAQEFVDRCEERPGTPLVEQRIGYSRYFTQDVLDEFGEAFGTLDDARLADGIVGLIDFKHGKGVQEFATDNTQLLLQALGVYEDFGHLFDIKGFEVAICQPRLGHYDSWSFSTEYLLEWAKQIPDWGIAVARGTDFRAGDWCKFCRIRKSCGVRAKAMTSLALEEGEFEDLDNLEMHAMRAQNRLQFITNEEIAKILPALGDFTKWIADVKKRAVGALLAKEDVGGWKLVAGRSSRKWLDEATAAHKLETLEVEPYAPPKVISVAVAEDKLGKKEFGRRFKLSEDFKKPVGKPTLAPAEDRRPAMELSEVSEFENLDDD